MQIYFVGVYLRPILITK